MMGESPGGESEAPGAATGTGESQSDNRTGVRPVAWRELRRTRWAYRILLVLVIALFAAARVAAVSGSDAERVSLPNALFVSAGFLYAAFLYYFLETARLMGYPWLHLLGLALLALLPVANIPTIVTLDLWTGVAIARGRQAAIAPTEIATGMAETADTAAGRSAMPACKPLIQRLLVSFLVGLVVFAISCNAGFNAFRDLFSIQWAGRDTLSHIANVRKAIETYRQEKHALPNSLRDLTPPANGRFPTDETGMPLDDWKRPLHYSTDGASYRVTSYGRDGKPGGMGLDCDLSTTDLPKKEVSANTVPPLPQRATATFRQFVDDLSAFGRAGSGRGMFLASIWAGVVAFILGFVLSGTVVRTRRGALITLLQVVITIIGTLFIAMIITILHIPTGH